MAQRTRELGIRRPLGARPLDIFSLILRNSTGLILGGLALGTMLALFSTRLVARYIYGISPLDPVIYSGVDLLLLAAAFTASYPPALKARRVDPMVVLRYE